MPKHGSGKEGDGFKVAMTTLDGGRIGIAAQALGIARAAFEEAARTRRSASRSARPIAKFQAIQFMLADMATEIDAARLLTLRAAAMKDRGQRHSTESADGEALRLGDGGRASPRRRSRSTADTATRRSSTSSATTATRASPRSTRGRARSSAW